MKAHCDHIFPATQFHLSVDAPIEKEKIPLIIEACRIPMIGLVSGNLSTDPSVQVPAIQVFGYRIIITTAHNIGIDDVEAISKQFLEAIERVL